MVNAMPRFLRASVLPHVVSALVGRVHYLRHLDGVVRALVLESIVPVEVMPGACLLLRASLPVGVARSRPKASLDDECRRFSGRGSRVVTPWEGGTW